MIFLVSVAAILQGLAPPDQAPAAPRAEGLAQRLARIETYVEHERASQRIPGLSIAIVHEGEAVWSRGFGAADVENDVPATAQTVYRIASITRMVTAVALLQLVQNGKISLRASVRDYVPELPDKGERITLEHLLPHLGGIRPCKSRDELYNRTAYRRLVDTLVLFKDDPLVAKPGEKFINTPFGYTLLGLVVERVTGTAFGKHLRASVFEPLGMKKTGVEDQAMIVPKRARGYILRKDLTLRNSTYVDLSARAPADGLVSTVDDLARFAAGFLNGKLLTPPFAKLMMTEYRTSAGESTHYGLGCFVREENGRRIIGHGGWQPQVSTFLVLAPDQRAAIVVLANLEQADTKGMALAILEMLLGHAGRE